MADAAARTEARRRRILENAEYRLQRITGHPSRNESQDERVVKPVDPQSIASNTPPNGIVKTETIMQNRTFDSLINEIYANIDTDEPSTKSEQVRRATQDLLNHILSGQGAHHERNTEQRRISNNYESVEEFSFNHSNDRRFLPASREPCANSLLSNLERDNPASNSIPERLSLLGKLLSGRLVYVILAVVVNIMVALKLEHLFGASIIVPFLAVMIGRLCTCKKNDAPQGHSMLVAALILSNCKPAVIQRLKGTFSLFGKVSRDIAVYIFTFVVLYSVISHYRDDRDGTSSQSEAGAIFVDDIAM